MMTRVEGIDADKVEIGMAVTARITEGRDGKPLLVFDAVEGAA